MQPFSRRQPDLTTVDVHYRFAGQYKEELLRAFVVVKNFRGPRGHLFLNHTELFVSDQMPSIAVVAPCVMFGGRAAH